MLAASFALASLLVAQAPAPSGWILTCDKAPTGPGAAAQTRTFRLGPGRLQEWKADQKVFGPNLCQVFRCRADRGRLEGAIESASVIFTITYDPQSKRASWRTTGISGGARTSGACAARPETLGPGAG